MCDIDVIEYAKKCWNKHNDSYFIFTYDQCMYRAKVNISGKINVKKICTGVVSLIGAKNIGTKSKPKWHYKFRIESEVHGSVEMLLNPSGFSSNLTFKTSIMRKIPVLFSGTKGDFDMFIDNAMMEYSNLIPLIEADDSEDYLVPTILRGNSYITNKWETRKMQPM